jgi:hypothetical protein
MSASAASSVAQTRDKMFVLQSFLLLAVIVSSSATHDRYNIKMTHVCMCTQFALSVTRCGLYAHLFLHFYIKIPPFCNCST